MEIEIQRLELETVIIDPPLPLYWLGVVRSLRTPVRAYEVEPFHLQSGIVVYTSQLCEVVKGETIHYFVPG